MCALIELIKRRPRAEARTRVEMQVRKRRSGKRDREKKTPQDNVRVVDHVQTWFTPFRCWAIGLGACICFLMPNPVTYISLFAAVAACFIQRYIYISLEYV